MKVYLLYRERDTDEVNGVVDAPDDVAAFCVWLEALGRVVVYSYSSRHAPRAQMTDDPGCPILYVQNSFD